MHALIWSIELFLQKIDHLECKFANFSNFFGSLFLRSKPCKKIDLACISIFLSLNFLIKPLLEKLGLIHLLVSE